MQIWKKLTDGLKNDSKNLANFHQSTWKDQNWDFDGIILPTIKIHELKIYRGVICNDTEERWNIWGRIYLLFQNWHEGFDEFDMSTWKSQKGTLQWAPSDQSM